MLKISNVAVMLFVAIGFVGSAFGQANHLQDLVGTRGSSGEAELEKRGYAVDHVTKDEDGAWGYWWNHSKNECVMVLTFDGKYSKIMDAEDTDCGHKPGLGKGSKVAIALAAAAAGIGVAAVAHKAHNHDDDRHWEDSNQEADYERGYRDGMYNQSYHNWSNSSQYSSGYAAGVGERRHQTSYSSGWGGFRTYQNVRDLQGSRASGAESQMQSRGFRNMNTYKAGDASYQTWYNGGTRQCIQVIVSDGRYESVNDIGSSPYCR